MKKRRKWRLKSVERPEHVLTLGEILQLMMR